MKKFLPEICTIQYGFPFDSAKFSTSEGMPLIRIRDVVRGYSETFTTEEYKEEYIVSKDDLLIGMDGEFNIAKWGETPALLNQRVCRLFPTSEVDKNYLFYFMPSALKRIEEKTPFVTVKHLSAKELNKVKVPLPPLDEQRRIATVLDKVSDLIAKRREQLDKLDELVKARFVEMFGNFIFDRDRWEICKVGSVADTIDPQPSHRTPPVSIDGIPYIGIAECNYETWHIDFEKARKVGKNVLREHQERYTLDNGDFIIGKIGTIGKPFPIPAKQTYTLSANTILIKPIKNKVMPQFLFAVFQSEFMDRIIDAEKKSTSQPAFGIQKVRNIEMPLPPMKLQQGFSDFVEQLGKSKLTIQQSLDKLEVLKKALMQQYFG